MNLKRPLAAVCILFVALAAEAKPKKMVFNNSPGDVFRAAMKTARERHVISYVDEKQLLISFSTGVSVWSKGFNCNASVEPEGEGRATLIINVQNKNGLSMGAGDRMAEKFFEQVKEELAGEVSQKAAVRPEQKSVDVAPQKAVPEEPTVTKAASATMAAPELKGMVNLTSDQMNPDIYVDGDFVGQAPVTLRLSEGKHKVKVTKTGYREWARDLTVHSGSEVSLRVSMER